ncbi:hypothetical protein QDX25_04970 [Auritidibacter ignavus]|nr:hypothetical protein [Auritidibacter ignavus]WGH82505.1 hypothetical protein QDX25_04970 [Auritidibacter ignavus]WGH91696.1 hypothetical protein QDX23_04880 [Auritidibacter ignavus]WHS27564.1 hypothetical protein QM395_09295 [Auritidibacter ignavus]
MKGNNLMGEIDQIIERMEQGEISHATAEELILFAQEREDDARRRREGIA